ncbi:MAG TPA: hypothetical protein VK714_23450 [Myxococcota bacterium]|nr:hypothetical protein [Myxococcota bacterium]
MPPLETDEVKELRSLLAQQREAAPPSESDGVLARLARLEREVGELRKAVALAGLDEEGRILRARMAMNVW